MKFGVHNPSWQFDTDPGGIFEAVKTKALWAEEQSRGRSCGLPQEFRQCTGETNVARRVRRVTAASADRVLITGSAGAVGTALRAGRWRRLRLTDIRRVPNLSANEELVTADLADRPAVEARA